MKKFIALTLSALLCLSVFTACSSKEEPTTDEPKAENQTLTLYTWEGMFPDDVLTSFTDETGIKINYASFDLDETMYAKLEAAKGGEYDLVIADDYIIETVIKNGLAQKLDKSKLSNLDNVNPVYQGQFYDTTDEYTVPYGAGVLTIAYNPAATDETITCYEDLWKPAFKDSLGIIGNYRVINGMALKTFGESYNTTDVDVLTKAGEKLNELAPNIRLIKDAYIQDDLVAGEISAAVMYTSQVTLAKLANPEIVSVFPKEGLGFGVIGQFIPVNAPNSDAAHKFIDYILQPEVSASCFEWMGYYSTNKAADELINADYRDFLTLPSDLDTSNAEMIENIDSETEALHAKIWTEFKTATGK